MKNFFSILFKILLLLFLLGLSGGYYYLYQKLENLGKTSTSEAVEVNQATKIESEPEIGGDACGKACKEEIEKVVSNAIATLSASRLVTSTALPTSPKTTSYIGLGTSYSTKATDWVNIDDTKVYIDLENDYGKNAKVFWEASLKVAHSNGKAFVRLYDDTHKIAVDFSELSTENNATFKQVSSGSLPFWRGRNLYVVQIKSLNSFEVTYSGGRIKVNY